MILCVSIQKKISENNMLSHSSLPAPKKTFLLLSILVFLFPAILPGKARPQQTGPYRAVPGLIDIRTSHSDGTHTMEEIVEIARLRGFRILFINDHDRIALSYGVPPFRRLVRYKKEFPSIMTHGPETYLNEIKRLSKEYPDMIIIPGCITSPYYYWTGSWFNGNLTVHDYDRRILIINFTRPEDYSLTPNLGNNLSLRYTTKLLPGLVIFIIPFIIGIILLRWRGFSRLMGLFLVAFSALAMIDYNPFRSSPFSPYSKEQGIAPYQEVIDYVNERGAFSFWNYPEQRSGVRTHGPIRVDTPPYPEVLRLSKNCTGFSAIYGDNITVTNPGREWDRVLNEYCRGQRERPPWGISTADFHEDGRLGLKLGAFPTTFLIKDFSKKGVLEALEKGRMYCSRGDARVWPKLNDFRVSGDGAKVAFLGETLTSTQFPIIRFRVSFDPEKPTPMTILLIRGGTLIKTFRGVTPIDVEYVDREAPPGETTYYRIMDTRKHLTSNPIFVTYRPSYPK